MLLAGALVCLPVTLEHHEECRGHSRSGVWEALQDRCVEDTSCEMQSVEMKRSASGSASISSAENIHLDTLSG